MSNYNIKLGTGKLGVNLVKSFVDENECYFHEIVQENDVGIDAFIEFTKNGENNGKCIAVQIKNGSSYFYKNKTMCEIPIDNHYNYWENHSLEVYGIVCDCANKKAYWVSITNFIISNKQVITKDKPKYIKFPIMEMNTLTTETFGSIFKQLVCDLLPLYSFEQALSLTQSNFVYEKEIAITILSKNYAFNLATWDVLIKMLNEETDLSLLNKIVYYLSYVSRHPDLYGDLNFTAESKRHANSLLKLLDSTTIVKMLSLTEEDGIARGTIGQSVESIIFTMPDRKNILIDIIDNYNDSFIGETAFYILSYYDAPFILANKDHYKSILNELAELVIEFCEKFGNYDLY